MGNRIRVALVIGQLSGGGAERQAALLATNIDRAAFDLRVICFTPGGIWADYLVERGVSLEVIPRRGHYDFSRHLHLYRWMKRHRPHVVLAEMSDAHLYATPAAVAAGVNGIAVGYRTVDFEWGRDRLWLERALLPYVDVQIANADAVSRAVAQTFGTNQERHWVIYNALDYEAFPRHSRKAARDLLGAPDEEFLIGFVASFSKEKQHETAVRAMAQLRDACPNLRLVLLGDGPTREEIQRLGESLGMSDRLRFLGYRTDVSRLLPAFDVTLNCSRREGCCNAIIESMAAGIPVLASAVGGNVDLIQPGEHGELFTSGSGEELAVLLRSAYTGLLDLERYGRACREFASQHFDLKHKIFEFEALFRALAALPRRRPLGRRGPVLHQHGVSKQRFAIWADRTVERLPDPLRSYLQDLKRESTEIHLISTGALHHDGILTGAVIHRVSQLGREDGLRLLKRISPHALLVVDPKGMSMTRNRPLFPGGPVPRFWQEALSSR